MKALFSTLSVVILASLGLVPQSAAQTPFDVQRCVNMGNALDAPSEGLWGHTIDLNNFARIKQAGFDTVRIPVRWSAHLDDQNTIAPSFFRRVDEVINAALAADLKIVLNVHHFEEIMSQPDEYTDTFNAIWDQLSYYYQDLPLSVSFETLNEPYGELHGAKMRRLQAEAITRIRVNNPDRIIILGGEDWSGLKSLDTNLRTEDPNVIYTFHYYQPFDFTHQDAPWTGPNGPKGKKRWGSESERRRVRAHMEQAARFASETGRPVFLGEFGAYTKAPKRSRLKYIEAVRTEAEAAGLGWCVWNFTATFPLFDDRRKRWLPGQLRALGLSQR